MTTQAQLSSDEAKQVVINLGTVINDESFQTARICVADDMNNSRFSDSWKRHQNPTAILCMVTVVAF